MARTSQKLINYHGSSVLTSAANLDLGEIAVVHGSATDASDVRLGIKDGKGSLRWFLDSAATYNAITAATKDVSSKADKVVPASAGNFAALDADGNLKDSGKKAADFAEAEHTHVIDDVNGLQDALNGKASTTHTHSHSDITDWDTEMAKKANKATTLSGYGITDANISADGVITLGDKTIKPLTAFTQTQLTLGTQTGSGKFITGATVSNHEITFASAEITTADITDLTDKLNNKVDVVEGSRLMTDAESTKLAGIAEGAQVNVIETVKVNGTALEVTNKSVDITVPAQDTYVLRTEAVTIEGATLQFALFRTDGTTGEESIAGQSIGFKDMVVTSGEVVKDPSGQPAGTYLKLTIANQTNPVYINVADLAHDYSEGNGIAISDDRVISVKINTGATKGNVDLTTDADGLKASISLGDYVPTARTIAGVDLADNVTKDEMLDALNVADGAQVNKIEKVQLNGSDLAIENKAVNVTALQSVALGEIAGDGDSTQCGAKIKTTNNAAVLDLRALVLDCGSWD